MGGEDRPQWIRHLVLLILGLALVAGYVIWADTGRVLDHIEAIEYRSLGLAFALAFLAYVPRIWSLKALSANADRPLSIRESCRAGFGSNALNLLLPARLGDIATVASLSRDRSSPDATAILFGWRALSLTGLVCLWGALLVAALTEARPAVILAWTIAGGLVLTAAVAYTAGWTAHRGLPLGRRILAKLRTVDRIDALIDWGNRFLRRGLAVFSPRAVVLPSLALFLVWLLDVGVAAVFILGLVPEVSFVTAFLAPIVANLSKLVRLTPGGIGIYEGVLSGLLVAAGGEFSGTVAAAAVGHAFLNIVMLLLGAVPAYLIAHHTSLSITDAKEQVVGSEEDPTSTDP
jgi:uncharacterized protein (TIRG00374 family)